MRNISVVIVTILTSFTSLFYYLMLSAQLSELTGEETLAQSISLGVYLTGMALGSGITDKILPFMNAKSFKWRLLIQAEMFVASIGSSLFFLGPSILGFYLIFLNPSLFSPYDLPLTIIFMIYLPLAFLLGFFSGKQLPIILNLYPKEESLLLFLNYMGALFAGIIINSFLNSGLSTQMLLVFVLILNFFTLIILVKLNWNKKLLAYFIGPIVSLAVIINVLPKIEKAELLSYYLGFKIQRLEQLFDWSKVVRQYAQIERVISPYQKIDIVTEPPQSDSYFHGNVSLYLNRKPQFDLYTHKTYHQSMVVGSFNLARKIPKKVLILGAGDGILAHQLLMHKEVESIVMVELDPKMVEVAKTHRVLWTLNGGVFEMNDLRFKVVIADAISYLRDTNEQFDGIFIDFPYPYSNELKKLYSLEFYKMVNSRLYPDGFFIFDFPLESEVIDNRHNEMTSCLLNTLERAGFRQPFGFGPYSSFVFITKRDKETFFIYSEIPENIDLSTSLNLVSLEHVLKRDRSSNCYYSLFYGRD